jgi:hypothetical protein
MRFNIELTWSKAVALVVLALAFVIDLMNGLPGTVFMFSLPFAVFLITGKQFFDHRKELKNGK